MVVRVRIVATPIWGMREQSEGVGRLESQASDHQWEDGLTLSWEGKLGGFDLLDVFCQNYMGRPSLQSLNPPISHALEVL